MAGIRSLLHRLVNIPMDRNDYQKELHIIKQIGRENNFPPQTINKVLKNINRKSRRNKEICNITLEKEHSSKPEVYSTFNYINPSIHRVTNIFKKQGVNIAFRTNNTHHMYIHNSHTIEKKDPYNKAGVYKLTCNDVLCKASYIGQSGRCIRTRYKEHRMAAKYNKHSSFSEHMLDEDHSFTDLEHDTTVLHFANKSQKLNILESIEIYLDRKNNPNNLNEHTIYNPSVLFSHIH